MRSGHPKPHVEFGHRSISAKRALLLSKFYVPILVWVIAISVLCGTAYSADGPVTPSVAADSAIVIGFVGGFVRHDDRRHAEVQLAEKLRAQYGSRAHIGIFENHREEDARQSILKWLDSDDSGGDLSDTEKQDARIILYGHSWGASAVVALARELQKDRIPVLLTIQVDSITKPGQDARVIPANVARAVNFYQTRGIFHGVSEIVPADPLRTEILGDIRLQYQKQPEPCSAYPWFARHFLKGHTAIECDPKLWSRIETLIGEYLLAPDTKTQSTISRNF